MKTTASPAGLGFRIPDHLKPEFDRLTQQVRSLRIDPQRVAACVWMLIRARNRPESGLPRTKTLATPGYLVAGYLHGIEDGEKNPDHTTAVYNRGIRARQRVHAAASASLKKLTEVIEQNEPDQQILFRDEGRLVLRAMKRFVACSAPGENLLKRKRPKEGEEQYSDETSALLMWREHFRSTRARKYWEDMYALAQAWDLTRAVNLGDFRRSVVRLCQGVT